jgi:two-component system, OmpR family, response regulator
LDIPRILVVEDSVEISEALSFFCSARKDIECNVANTGQEGLDRIRAENFDLILLDLAMPQFSGMEVLLSLKLDGLIKSRNIVIFTASSNQDLLNEIRDIGVKEIFKKPFSLDDLIKLIESYRPMT